MPKAVTKTLKFLNDNVKGFVEFKYSQAAFKNIKTLILIKI